ncbi:MAG: hypothetical protein IT438_14980 [Phycisphaerales bacterium]|nr:hypothetical protein [Phycisphaerales bacterium]
MGRKPQPTPPAAPPAPPAPPAGPADYAAGLTAVLDDDGPEMAVLLGAIKPPHRERFRAIVALSDAYCLGELEPLGREYAAMARVMAAGLCQGGGGAAGKGSPVVEGKTAPEGWAAAIVAAVGFVNFLGDKSTPPTKTMAQVAAGLGVSESGLAVKSVKVRKMLDLRQFDPEWTLPSLLDKNPLVWMLETTTGLVVDIRHRPREEQERAFELGLIPYIPAERAGAVVEVKTRGGEGVIARIGDAKGAE